MRNVDWRRENGVETRADQESIYFDSDSHETLPPLLQQIPTQFGHGIQRFSAPWLDISLLPLFQELLFFEVE